MLKSGMPIRSGPTTLTCSSLGGPLRRRGRPRGRPAPRRADVGRRSAGATLRRSRGRGVSPDASPARARCRSARRLWISRGASAGLPRSRSTGPVGTLIELLVRERRSHRVAARIVERGRTSPARRPRRRAAGGGADADAGLGSGGRGREQVELERQRPRRSASARRRQSRRCRRGALRSRSARLGRSGGMPIGKAMSDAGSAPAPPARCVGSAPGPRARCGRPARCAAMSSTQSPR